MMKTLFAAIGLGLFLMAGANGAAPALNVMVSDATGKLAFKGATKSDGAFATGKLQPGNYVVQFSSTDASLKGGLYSIIVAAGQKKVVADSLAGAKFLGGGVAMKVQVGAGSNIFGHVAAGPLASMTAQQDHVRKMQDRAQDSHQQGFHNSPSNTQDKMYRPGGN